MALVSGNVFRNWRDEIDRFHREMENDFKRLSLARDDHWWPSIPAPPTIDELMKPWDRFLESMNQYEQQIGGSTMVERDEDKYRVIVDVQQFAPEEITVRTDDKCITIEGKHEEKKDQHGYVSRHFVRRYQLPQGYDIGHVKPSLSTDGILTITAPRLTLPAPGERIVQIERTNRPAIKAT